MRLATPKDIGALKNLRLQILRELSGIFPKELPGAIQSYLEKHLPNRSCPCALLETDVEPAAMVMLCACVEMPDKANVNGKGAKLSSVYTLPVFRGEGHMERLLLYLLEEAKNTTFRK